MKAGFLKTTAVLAMVSSAGFVRASDNTTFTYDALGRLVAVSEASGPNAGVQTAISYDPVGNRATYAVSGGLGAGATFSINSASTTEGGTAVFTVSKAGTASGTTSVNFSSDRGSATSPSDFIMVSGKLTFAQGETSKTISVQTVQDSLVEGNESFSVTLQSPSLGSVIGLAYGSGAIIDDDSYPPPTFSVSDADPVTEGGILQFAVTPSGPASGAFSINYSTSSGSATADSDFTPQSGTLTFHPDSSTHELQTKFINVATVSDGVDEGDETLHLSLSAPSGGAQIVVGQATGTILGSATINSPPVAAADSATLVSRCPPNRVNVVQNDTDPDGDSITLLSVTPLNGFQFGIIGDEIWMKAWDGSSRLPVGTHQITYTIKDAKGLTAQGILTLTVIQKICEL